VTRVVWTQPARDDLREVRAYIAHDSARYARLGDYPLSGRVVPELGRPTIREVIDGSYRIYRVTPDAVQILAVVHATRRFPLAGRDPSV
jgi:toxin ParE1/3/4